MALDIWIQEQALYEKEGLNVKKIEYVDNQDCIGERFMSDSYKIVASWKLIRLSRMRFDQNLL